MQRQCHHGAGHGMAPPKSTVASQMSDSRQHRRVVFVVDKASEEAAPQSGPSRSEIRLVRDIDWICCRRRRQGEGGGGAAKWIVVTPMEWQGP
mmetsp:Transcript_30022/g.55468  ORF Transcript_30022/g.55468 Transcript_30022/m.55468 type:complete len:93 (+) Transcript_30022:138-416(+)